MKLSSLKRWKLKQKKYNQKYKLGNSKNLSSLKNRQDFSGKYLFLMSTKNLCTILKFITKNSCVTEAALIVDDYFTKQMAKRIFITSKHNKKLMKDCKVLVTKKYKDEIMEIVRMSESSQSNKKSTKKITPLRILSCKFCDEKFTDLTALDQHYKTQHKLTSDNDETDNEMTEREIDEILQDPNNVPIKPKIVINEYDMNMVG